MDFDGTMSREGDGEGIWMRPPKGEPRLLSYKLYFKWTNNVVEYKTLVLGLKVLKDIKARKIYIYGDSEFIINQVRGSYQAKNRRLRSYRNMVLDLLEIFKEYHFLVIPRKKNSVADALAVSASVFKIPAYPNKKYETEVKHKPTILDNIYH